VEPGALFHIRIRLDLAKPQQAFTNECLGQAILDSVIFYEEKTPWHITLFLLMPDHRLRLDERGAQLSAKLNYIRQKPVAAGLCARAEDWPRVIDPFGRKGGSSCPQDDECFGGGSASPEDDDR
jgi:hypothetical protein